MTVLLAGLVKSALPSVLMSVDGGPTVATSVIASMVASVTPFLGSVSGKCYIASQLVQLLFTAMHYHSLNQSTRLHWRQV